MAEELWTKLDHYYDSHLVVEDEALIEAKRAREVAGMPDIAVAANQGKFIHMLARLVGARRILEIGTLGGYSTIWLARALPDGGRLVTLEYEPEHARVAQASIASAGLGDVVEVRVGAALDSLPGLVDEDPFDFFFIDADKVNNPYYLEWALQLGRPGSLVVLDNVVRGGKVVDPEVDAPDVAGTRAAIELLGSHPRFDAVALQTVGAKGWDGFAVARILP